MSGVRRLRPGPSAPYLRCDLDEPFVELPPARVRRDRRFPPETTVMRRFERFPLRPLLVLLALLAFGGCNTVEGMGEDMEDAGDAIEDSADDDDLDLDD